MIIYWKRGPNFQFSHYYAGVAPAWSALRAAIVVVPPPVLSEKGYVFFDYQQIMMFGALTTEVICYPDRPIVINAEEPFVIGQGGRRISIRGTVSTNL